MSISVRSDVLAFRTHRLPPAPAAARGHGDPPRERPRAIVSVTRPVRWATRRTLALGPLSAQIAPPAAATPVSGRPVAIVRTRPLATSTRMRRSSPFVAQTASAVAAILHGPGGGPGFGTPSAGARGRRTGLPATWL